MTMTTQQFPPKLDKNKTDFLKEKTEDEVFELNNNEIDGKPVIDGVMESCNSLRCNTTDGGDVSGCGEQSSVNSHVDEERENKFTRCRLCADMFTQPKLLPCLHTFCLQCLQQHFDKNTASGNSDRVTCPWCDEAFPLPVGGLDRLPANAFFARLTERRRTLSTVDSPDSSTHSSNHSPLSIYCSVCHDETASGSDDDDVTDRKSLAKYACADCGGDRMCEECAAAHRKQKLSRGHQLVPLNGGTAPTLRRSSSSFCPSHPGEQVAMYCADCDAAMCEQCLRQPGSTSTTCSHSASKDITTVAHTGRTQLEQDHQVAGDLTLTADRLSTSLDVQRQSFEQQIDDADRLINESAQLMCKIVENERQRLLTETATIRHNTIAELDKLAVDMVSDRRKLEGLGELTSELLQQGDDVEVASLSGRLRTERHRLETIQAQHDVSVCIVKFRPTTTSAAERSTVLGKLMILDVDDADPYFEKPALVHTVPGSRCVAGLTVLDAELYVVRQQCHDVEVYSVRPAFPAVRRLVVQRLRQPTDIVASTTASVVYVADALGYIFVIDPHGQIHARFQVEGEPQGLCVSRGNLYVTCGGSRLVKVYTGDGLSCLRSFKLQQDVVSPWHTVPLPDSDKFLVSHGLDGGKLHRLCVVDSNGKVCRAYGAANGCGTDRLDAPQRLAIDVFGYVFVLDRNNDRIILVSPNLVYVRDLVGRTATKQPRRMWFDRTTGHLYVGYLDGRVAVFHVINVAAHEPSSSGADQQPRSSQS